MTLRRGGAGNVGVGLRAQRAAQVRGSARVAAARDRGGIWLVPSLLALHAALALWGAARNSVTFDENFHLPAGVVYVARGYPAASIAQPPLVKALCALPALAAGARVPPDSVVGIPEEVLVGESFMRVNADRYQRVYFAGRTAVVALSVLLGRLIWRFATRLYGSRGGWLALAAYALSPEALAHAGVVGMDLATGLGFLASIFAFWRFCRSGRWAWWGLTAMAVGATALTRFSAIQLAPILVLLAAAGTVTGRLRRARRVWLGLALLPITSFAALQLGYLGHTSFAPLSLYPFVSSTFQSLQSAHPDWRSPLPDAYLVGIDYVTSLSQSDKPSYLLGHVRTAHVWYYFPLALLFKWPLGFWGLVAARAGLAWRAHRPVRRLRHEAFLLVPIVVVLGSAMAARLEFGIRYVFPILPFVCVWLGGLVPHAARLGRGVARAGRALQSGPVRTALGRRCVVAAALLAILAIETATTAPWYLSFFNRVAGGPGGGDRLLNDSNVDWGQGLLALRDELRRRGIGRVHLAYHGTTDPSVYGIDYVTYRGGTPGAESNWLAVSSYFFVGLWSPMMTREGRSDFVGYDFRRLWTWRPAARPARCMYLFMVPHPKGSAALPLPRSGTPPGSSAAPPLLGRRSP